MAVTTIPNLREWTPMAGQAQNVEDTKMLDATAHEPQDTVTSNNTNKEDTNKTPSFGDLGAKGRN